MVDVMKDGQEFGTQATALTRRRRVAWLRHRAGNHEQPGRQPRDAHHLRDGQSQLRQLGVAKRLREPHQVDEPVRRQENRNDPAHDYRSIAVAVS